MRNFKKRQRVSLYVLKRFAGWPYRKVPGQETRAQRDVG